MWEHEGKLWARVTQDIIQSMKDKDGNKLVDFSHVPKEVLKAKAELGSRVHQHINDLIEGDFPVMSFQEKGYVESFEEWRRTIYPVFREPEKRYYCDQKRLTGAIDTLIELDGKEKCVLVDFKTSAQESPVTWPIQAHLYYYLVTSSGRQIAKRFLFVKLDKNGFLPKVYEYKYDQNIMDRALEAVDRFWDLRTFLS